MFAECNDLVLLVLLLGYRKGCGSNDTYYPYSDNVGHARSRRNRTALRCSDRPRILRRVDLAVVDMDMCPAVVSIYLGAVLPQMRWLCDYIEGLLQLVLTYHIRGCPRQTLGRDASASPVVNAIFYGCCSHGHHGVCGRF